MANLLAHDIDSKDRTKDVKIDESISFSNMLLPKFILEGLSDNGFKTPSPIQLAAIPRARCGLDLIVQSKSGTGKTLVFGITALESINLNLRRVQVIVLAPTREIAIQIADVIRKIGKAMKGLKVSSFVGGRPLNLDKPSLKHCHIAVGSPGRIRHLIEEKFLDSEAVRLLVLDEADQLFNEELHFQKDINFIFNKCGESKQLLAVSATYPPQLVEFTNRFMRSGQVVTPAGGPTPVLLGLRQFIIRTRDHPDYNARNAFKEKELFHILSTVTFDLCCIFHHYASRAESMNHVLLKKGFSSVCLTGKQSMEKREAAMEALRTGKCRILVTTDLAARGIDASSINLVINMGLPWNPASYLHRMGRAGRYGSQGVCISLISEGMELNKFQKLLGRIGGASMSVNVVPKIRKFDLWNDDLADFDKLYGVLSSDDEVDEDESEDSNTATSDEMKIENNTKNKNNSENSTLSKKPSQKDVNTLSLKDLQVELDTFIKNEKKCQGKKSELLEKKNDNNEKTGVHFPLSYSQVVSGKETLNDSSSSSSTLTSSFEVVPSSPKKSLKTECKHSPVKSPSQPPAELSESRRSKRKRGGEDWSSCSSEFESDSYEILTDDSDETMYTVDEVEEDDSRSGIDLNNEATIFDESLSDISCEHCYSAASQKDCPHCKPYKPDMLVCSHGTWYTDWYAVLSKEINDYVNYSRKFRMT